ncbi:polysaccharide biosynthesis tyrosine autokinase [Nonomuraea sp. NPDC050536]|uniref:polysaccharide biosynthesis tyrosine autokinase n=1 Tax=Nonomuraea sp. NPDC050536 TaxID=3364366 RepID=UPI0037C9D2CC
MDLVYYIRLARRNLLLILLSLALALSAAYVVTVNTPKKYEATISLLVSAQNNKGSTATAYQAVLLSQERVKSYANLLTSRRVLEQLVGSADVRNLQDQIRAEAVPETVLLRATVTDTDPARARRLADALGTTFTRLIDELERPAPGAAATVRVTVVDRAELPTVPVSPKPVLNFALAVLLSLLVSAGTIILRDRLDTTIKSSDTMQKISNSPTLGIISFERDARKHPLIVRAEGGSARAEAFRSLRTNLQFIGVDQQPKSLVVTSSLPGEGKSSTASNLAIALTQAGWRVILVDADLRRPRIPEYLGIEGGVGLTDVLIGRAELGAVMQRWGRDSLSVLPSGPVPPNPSELLGSHQMRLLLKRLTADFDMVIIDAPPLLPVTDAAALAAVCDGALLVARYGKSRREHLARAVDLLASVNARLLGTVLNFAPVRGGDGYGYGYTAYGYGEAVSEAEKFSERPTPVGA